MAWSLEGGGCFLLSSNVIFPASVSSSEHGKEITEIQVSALLEISLARATWSIQRDPKTTPIETFPPELRRLTQFTRFRKLVKLTRPMRPCLEVINEAANYGGEEVIPASCLEVAQEAPGVQLLLLVTHAGVSSLIMQLSACHPCFS